MVAMVTGSAAGDAVHKEGLERDSPRVHTALLKGALRIKHWLFFYLTVYRDYGCSGIIMATLDMALIYGVSLCAQ